MLTLIVAGLALTFVSTNVAALAHAGADEQGLAGGLFNTGLQVGGGVGLAVLASVSAAVNSAPSRPAGDLDGYRAAFWTATAISALGSLVAAVFVRPSPRTRRPSPTADRLLGLHRRSDSA